MFVASTTRRAVRIALLLTAIGSSAAEAQTTVYRSIGVTAGTLYSTGNASITMGTTTINFAGGACLPPDVGRGDRITFTGAPAETLFILDRVSSTRVTVQTAATTTHTNQTYDITRAYTTLAAWEAGQGGDLVAGNRVEVGVAYNDGPFTAGVSITGNTTDATRFMRLTVADRARHRGIAGTGVVLDGANTDQGIRVQQDYTVLEWFEIKRNRNSLSAAGVVVQQGGAPSPVVGIVVQNLLMYDFKDQPAAPCFPNCFTAGIRSQSGSTYTVRNTVIYDGEIAGIRNNAATSTGVVENCTIHGMNGTGVLLGSGSLTATNTIATSNGLADFSAGITQSNNLSSDGSASGAGSLTGRAAANQFVSLSAGAEDFHLKQGADAIDQGTTLTGATDVDGDGRPGISTAWDIGADEKGTVVFRSIGTNTGNVATGTASVPFGSRTVTFGAPIPANVGAGDVLTFTGAPAESFFILSRDSDTQVTLQSGAVSPHTAQSYTITRAFNSFQAWESARQGNLVTLNKVEVGVAYNDGPFVYNFGGPPSATPALEIDGSTTGPRSYLRVTVAPGQRHTGIAGTGVVLDGTGNTQFGIRVQDPYTVVDGLALKGFYGNTGGAAAITSSVTGVLLRNLLIHGFFNGAFAAGGIRTETPLNFEIPGYTAQNCIVYDGDQHGIRVGDCDSSVVVENATVFNMRSGGRGIHVSAGKMTVKNSISVGNTSIDFRDDVGGMTQSNNLSSDATAAGPSSLTGRPAVNQFVNVGAGTEDLHLKAGADAIDQALDLSSRFWDDVDGQSRLGLDWDMGADELGATTDVELVTFEARGFDHEVLVEWETASELRNLGFHLYRAPAAPGPYERITGTAIPGLGSSPSGARYRYVDSGLENGVKYYYELEDIDARGWTTRHGPIAATAVSGGGRAPAPSRDVDDPQGSVVTFGNPAANRLQILDWSRRGALVALTTEGFYASPNDDGTVTLVVPGFDASRERNGPEMPVLRPWLDALSESSARVVSVEEERVLRFDSLLPSGPADLGIESSSLGVVRRSRSSARRARGSEGLFPSVAARVLGSGFQGDAPKVQLELAPLRWDASARTLRLARRLVVRLAFDPSVHGEGRARRYRRAPSQESRSITSRLVTVEPGLYGASYEELVPRGRSVFRADSLRLTRLGEPVAFRIDPDPHRLAPGSMLYFLSPGGVANPYGHEAVFEMEIARGGRVMETKSERGSGAAVPYAFSRVEREEDRYYQAGLVDASERDLWLWDVLFSPAVKTFSFDVAGLASAAGPARLLVRLQGTSDFEGTSDHHIVALVNGAFVGESLWDGKSAHTLEAPIPPGVLKEGTNVLELRNTGDTGALYSMIFLDRFTVEYPRRLDLPETVFDGRFSMDGTARVGGLGPSARVLDVTDESRPLWLEGAVAGEDGTVSFPVTAGRRFLAVSRDALGSPRVERAGGVKLKSSQKRQPQYLAIAPSAFLATLEPLLRKRREQGLRSQAVAVEQIFDEFGFGEERPQAIRDFLAYVNHEWARKNGDSGLRYVLLVGDATYDFKDHLATGVANRVPALLVRTSYLWTASDPTLAMISGDDLLPDVAIGRLPAADASELSTMIDKILAFEEDVPGFFSAPIFLVADNPDAAGDFVADAEEIAEGVLRGRDVRKIYLSSVGAAGAREAILESFGEGPSLLSYMGHGGIALWAHENVLNADDVGGLAPSVRKPVALTMNCLNGYFHFPHFNSLAEELLKADDRGAVAAFSPSGLSLDGPAHRFHVALLEALFESPSGRLGDAVLRAQESYARSGAFPELLRIYHLLGDPALTIR